MKENDSPNSAKPASPGDHSGQDFLPPLDFTSIVFPFYSQALLQLGLLGDHVKAEPEMNLDLAHRLIDILNLLKDRTKGNLPPDEEKFLDSCLQQLRLAYLQKSKVIAV